MILDDSPYDDLIRESVPMDQYVPERDGLLMIRDFGRELRRDLRELAQGLNELPDPQCRQVNIPEKMLPTHAA